jgi:3-isopropylmalate/(R)-2-methylmalate dehydratase small subunit
MTGAHESRRDDTMSEAGARRLATIRGTGVPVPGHDIDTDRIIPARFLKSITFEGLDQHVFEDDRTGARQRGETHPFDEPAYQGAAVLFVNRNFGCGSSREHAPQALQRWGIQAVIGESYSEIFFGNSLALGLPCITVSDADANALIEAVTRNPKAAVTVDVPALTISVGELTVRATMPKSAHEALVTGAWDATGMLLAGFEEVQAVAARLPYVRGF